MLSLVSVRCASGCRSFLYTEAKHPRGRGGKWVDVMGKLSEPHPSPWSNSDAAHHYPGVMPTRTEATTEPFPYPVGAHFETHIQAVTSGAVKRVRLRDPNNPKRPWGNVLRIREIQPHQIVVEDRFGNRHAYPPHALIPMGGGTNIQAVKSGYPGGLAPHPGEPSPPNQARAMRRVKELRKKNPGVKFAAGRQGQKGWVILSDKGRDEPNVQAVSAKRKDMPPEGARVGFSASIGSGPSSVNWGPGHPDWAENQRRLTRELGK